MSEHSQPHTSSLNRRFSESSPGPSMTHWQSTHTRFARLLMALGMGASWNWLLLMSRYSSLVSL
jgi:hypothetical protein